MFIHIDDILCRAMAWILLLELRTCLSLLAKSLRLILWYFAILFSSYAYKGHGPPKILLWTPGDPWTPGWEPLS